MPSVAACHWWNSCHSLAADRPQHRPTETLPVSLCLAVSPDERRGGRRTMKTYSLITGACFVLCVVSLPSASGPRSFFVVEHAPLALSRAPCETRCDLFVLWGRSGLAKGGLEGLSELRHPPERENHTATRQHRRSNITCQLLALLTHTRNRHSNPPIWHNRA